MHHLTCLTDFELQYYGFLSGAPIPSSTVVLLTYRRETVGSNGSSVPAWSGRIVYKGTDKHILDTLLQSDP